MEKKDALVIALELRKTDRRTMSSDINLRRHEFFIFRFSQPASQMVCQGSNTQHIVQQEEHVSEITVCSVVFLLLRLSVLVVEESKLNAISCHRILKF